MAICIPYGAGVFNMEGPPNWGLPNGTAPVIDVVPANPAEGAIKDPRWLGAVNQSFGIGTAEEASFRAVWTQANGAIPAYLYFSWHVKFDSDPGSTEDRLFVVIAPSANGGVPLVLEIQPFNDTAEHATATAPIITAGRRQANGTSATIADPPDWLNDTKAWRTGAAAAQGQWAVHVRVPIDPAATDVDGNDGLRLTTQFNMWYEFRIKEPTRPGGVTTDITAGGFLRLNAPAGVTLTSGGTAYPNPNTAGQGETYTYGSVVGINQVSCAASSGISIGYLDIGTDNSPTSFIHPTNQNTFWAKPTNKTGATVPTGKINATFRLANWGSSRTDATWTTIQSGVPNSAGIAHNTTATSANDNRFNKSGMVAAFPQAALNIEPHQCMTVELSGAGLLFTNTSVVRNMDFINNSKVVRSATISVVGLTPIDSRPRDVYLAVETINMPRQSDRDFGVFGPVNPGDLMSIRDQHRGTLSQKLEATRGLIKQTYNPDKHAKPEQRLSLMLDALAQVGATTEDLDQIFPTYRVHVYYDTGETWTVKGVTYPLLGLQPSFGFYAYHEGRLLGFNNQLRGAIRVAENFYIVRAPNNGSAKITTIIHGIAPGEEGSVEPEEPIRDWPKKAEYPSGCLHHILKLFGLAK